MPNLSTPVPGSPQSSALTVKGSVVVPVDLMTEAMPVNLACVSGPHEPLVMDSELYDRALIRTSIGWSSYSRFPVGGEPGMMTKPKLAWAFGSDRLGTSAGGERSTPRLEKMGSPWI